MKRGVVNVVVLLLIGSVGAMFLGACQQNRSAQVSGEVHVDVTDKGFEPADVTVPAGQPVTLVMTRKTDQTCAKEFVFASLNQRYPRNQRSIHYDCLFNRGYRGWRGCRKSAARQN